jgi:hypothetical protein
MKLLLITGAGASRNLSVDSERPMLLMTDWRERLCADIGDGLAQSTGLDRAETGEQFEETLGALFRYREQMLPLGERFVNLARKDLVGDMRGPARFDQGLKQIKVNIDKLMAALHKSLFREFGPKRINAELAVKAYDDLLDVLTGAGSEPPSVICATTNYDRSLEIALEKMGRTVRTGFAASRYLTPTLDPQGLGAFDLGSTGLLYLHGAVGWYKKNDVITSQAADQDFNPTLGDPAVLYPSTNKDIEKSETRELWTEFDAAIEEASHIFILGHGLNDDHLVAALREATCPIAVAVYPGDGDEVALDEIDAVGQTKAVLEKLPKAHPVGLDFGPMMRLEKGPLEHWLRDLDPWHGNAPSSDLEQTAA